MTSIELMSELAPLGVDLTTDGDNLKVDAPAGVLTPELQQGIREHKQKLIKLLRQLEVAIIKRQLEEKGWVIIHSAALNEPIIWCKNENVSIPPQWSGLAAYTLNEIKALLKHPIPDAEGLRLLNHAKKQFRGRLIDLPEAKHWNELIRSREVASK